MRMEEPLDKMNPSSIMVRSDNETSQSTHAATAQQLDLHLQILFN